MLETSCVGATSKDQLVMEKRKGSFRRITKWGGVVTCLWLSAIAFGSDETSTSPITSKGIDSRSILNAEGCPSPCDCLCWSPLTFQLRRTVRVKAGGFARLDVLHDCDAIGDRYEFVTTSIPTDGRIGSKSTFSARQTRFNLDILDSRSTLHVFAEGDFFGERGDFRLRHAYGEFHGLMIGQNWSTFQDESIIPTTLDYEGPVGMVFARTPQARLTMPWGEQVEFAIAIEDASRSDSNTDIPFAGVDDHRLPDLVGRLRYELPAAHVQVSSVLREVGFRSDVVPDQRATGWGAAVSGAWLPRETDQLYAQFAFGEGFARYIEDLEATNSDAALDLQGNLVALPTIGFFTGWQHHWTDCLQSNLVFGFASVSNSAGQFARAFHQSSYISGNVIWTPLKNLDLGCEVLWGNRRDKSLADGEAVRFQFSTTFRF